MNHRHHEWLAEVTADIEADYVRLRELAATGPARIQQVGHEAESIWVKMLESWLPPQYEVATRRYILTEEDVPQTTPEVDLVVFQPSYPRALRKKTEVLAAGVAAAFSVKLTVDRAAIREATRVGAQLRRGMKPRGCTIRHELVPPLIFGLLSHSHVWTKPSSKPISRIEDALIDADMAYAKTPREALDLLCVSDLNSWFRSSLVRTPDLVRAINSQIPGAHEVAGVQSWMVASADIGDSVPPMPAVPVFITSLLSMLARNDSSVAPLADGFRLTGTAGSGRGSGGIWPLHEAFSDGVIAGIERGMTGPDWLTMY